MKIRALRENDLEAITQIEHRALPDPWSEAQLQAEMAAANGLGLGAEIRGHLCGYAFFRFCAPECELLHLIVAPEWRRHGAGAALLRQASAWFAEQGYAACFLEVRCSNQAALSLYAKAGFLQVGRRKNYYRHPIEDALQLCRNLNERT